MTTTTEKYRALAKLGAGGMASVELAVMSGSAGINKLLVVKKLLAHLAKDASYVAMFVNEARVAARLSHPNVVTTYEIGSDGEVPFIVMEYLEGQSLSALFRRVGRPHVTLAHQLHALRGLLAGLQYAHTLIDFDGQPLGLVHRDVSPQNVFVCYDGRVKLVDFGIAKVNGLGTEAKPGVLKGKIAYMAPEQLRGEPVDCRADLYSVGIMLWEALAGRRMTLGDPEAAVVMKRKRGEIPDVDSFNPLVPPPLKDVCLRALAASPQDRFASAAEMLHALDEAVAPTAHVAVERELGAFVAEAFAGERAKLQTVIESQLKSFTIAQAVPISLPELERVESSLGGAPSGEDAKSSATPSSGPVSLNQAGTVAGEVSAPPETPPVTSLPKRERTRGAVWAISLLGAGLLAAGGWFVAQRSGQHQTTAPSSPPAPSAASAPIAPAAAPSEIKLFLRAAPAKARFVLDGRSLSGNPLTLQVPKDGQAHQLRVSNGATQIERTLVFDREQAVDVSLPEELPEPRAAAAPPPGPEPAHDDGSKVTPAAHPPSPRALRARRTLDEQNPY